MDAVERETGGVSVITTHDQTRNRFDSERKRKGKGKGKATVASRHDDDQERRGFGPQQPDRGDDEEEQERRIREVSFPTQKRVPVSFSGVQPSRQLTLCMTRVEPRKMVESGRATTSFDPEAESIRHADSAPAGWPIIDDGFCPRRTHFDHDQQQTPRPPRPEQELATTRRRRIRIDSNHHHESSS